MSRGGGVDRRGKDGMYLLLEGKSIDRAPAEFVWKLVKGKAGESAGPFLGPEASGKGNSRKVRSVWPEKRPNRTGMEGGKERRFSKRKRLRGMRGNINSKGRGTRAKFKDCG